MDIFYVFFLRLISYLDGAEKNMAAIAMFSVLITHTLWLNSWKIKLKKQDLYPILVFLYLLFHTMIFSEITLQLLGILFSYLLWYFFIKNKFKNKSIFASIQFLVYSFTAYNLINFIWYEIEYAHLKTGINTTLALFNIVAYRVNFPMASGLTINSIQIGLTSLLTIYLIKNTSRFSTKLFFTVLYFWNIYLLVILDSRSPLLISLVLGIIVGFGLRQISSMITRYWIFFALLAVFIVHLFYNTSMFDSIKRPGELTEEFFNRPKIWGMAITHTFDDLRLLFGYGLYTFSQMISQYDESLSTTHNIFLQILYDFGFFGIIIMAFFLYKSMTILLRIKDMNLTIIFISFFLYGCLESIPSYYTFTVSLMFISILVIIFKPKDESV